MSNKWPRLPFRWLRWARLITGLWLFAAGISLMVESRLGVSPWDVLHDALGQILPLSFGAAVIAVSVSVVVVSLGLGVTPGLGTIANVVLVGLFTDHILWTGLLDGLASANTSVRLLALLSGVGAIAIGTALYIGAGLGAGPRDGLMLAVADHLGVSAGAARAVIEVSVLTFGTLGGGRVGIGTAIFTGAIGSAINISFRLLGMEPRARRKRSAAMHAANLVPFSRRAQVRDTSSRARSREIEGRI